MEKKYPVTFNEKQVVSEIVAAMRKANREEKYDNVPLTYAMRHTSPAMMKAEYILQFVIAWLRNDSQGGNRQKDPFVHHKYGGELRNDVRSVYRAFMTEISAVATTKFDQCVLLEHLMDCIMQRGEDNHLPQGILSYLARAAQNLAGHDQNLVYPPYRMLGDLDPYMTKLASKGVVHPNQSGTNNKWDALRRVQALSVAFVYGKTPEDLLGWYEERQIPHDHPFTITNKDTDEFRESPDDVITTDNSPKIIQVLGMPPVEWSVAEKYHVQEWHPNRICKCRHFVGDPHKSYLYIRGGLNYMYVVQPEQYGMKLRRI